MKYCVKDYVEELIKYGLVEKINMKDDVLDQRVEKLSYNSQEVEVGTLFVCKGASFREEYLNEAIRRGAEFYVSEKEYDACVPGIIVKDIKKSLSVLSDMFFGYPKDKLNVIGITGTKGKSTTAYYVKTIIDAYRSFRNEAECAILSSIDTYDGVDRFESHITTPESYDINRHFNNAVRTGIKDVVMEVSSQALKYDRVYTLTYDYSAFLNIGVDHISDIEHPNFEDYLNSKLKIFENSKVTFINMDADFYEAVEESAHKAGKVITFSMKNPYADIFAYDIQKTGSDTKFKVRTKDFDEEFELSMPGIFNIENALVAIGITYSMGIPIPIIKEALYGAMAKGRMELFSSRDRKVSVLVDYAHNKLSFEKLYESVRNEFPGHRIVTVFGCPGGKAIIRREHLGLLAGENSDKVFLTMEDPGMESTRAICEDIARYVKRSNDNYAIIEDRGEAICEAIKEATEMDGNTIILLTGKGRETREKIGCEYVLCPSDVDYTLRFLKEYDERPIKRIES